MRGLDGVAGKGGWGILGGVVGGGVGGVAGKGDSRWRGGEGRLIGWRGKREKRRGRARELEVHWEEVGRREGKS